MRHAGDWMRVMLSLILLCMVYGETGPITTFCFFLIMWRDEVQDCNAGLTFKDNQEGE